MDVKFTKSLGMLFLGIWLLMTGILHFVTISSDLVPLIMALLAIIAGVLILLGR